MAGGKPAAWGAKNSGVSSIGNDMVWGAVNWTFMARGAMVLSALTIISYAIGSLIGYLPDTDPLPARLMLLNSAK